MRCVLVKLPSISATWAEGKKKTSVLMSWVLTSPLLTSGAFRQKVALSCTQLSLTTSHSSLRRPARSRRAFNEAARFLPGSIIPFNLQFVIPPNLDRSEADPKELGCHDERYGLRRGAD